MPNGVHTDMEAMQPPARRPPLKRPAAEPKRAQLIERDEPMLTLGKRGDACVSMCSPGPHPRTCTSEP
jgi:hypothetical protein